VVVLGGGFGGLEAAFDLRMLAGERAKITLVSDQDHFFFKPNSITSRSGSIHNDSGCHWPGRPPARESSLWRHGPTRSTPRDVR